MVAHKIECCNFINWITNRLRKSSKINDMISNPNNDIFLYWDKRAECDPPHTRWNYKTWPTFSIAQSFPICWLPLSAPLPCSSKSIDFADPNDGMQCRDCGANNNGNGKYHRITKKRSPFVYAVLATLAFALLPPLHLPLSLSLAGRNNT